MDHLQPPLRAAGEPPAEPSAAGDAGPVLALPRRRLELHQRFAVMGIVNRTPDSFYDRGRTYDLDVALDHAQRMIAEGADIIDVGGIKGGPGTEVTIADERGRVVPFVERLRAVDDEVLISVDTFRADVASAVLDAGADIINDVTGLSDPQVLEVVAATGAGYVAMHHGGQPRTRPFRRTYEPDVTTAVVDHCRALTDRFLAAGVPRDRLLVDPGHDFQKTTWHSLELTRRLPDLAALGFGVLVALSNKDFLGEILDAPLEERLEASIAAAVFSMLRGAHVVRVHEVAPTVAALRTIEALLGRHPPAVVARGLE